MRQIGIDLRDPYADQIGEPDAMESMLVRYLYQQVPYATHQPLAEVGRLVEVCHGDDTFYDGLALSVIDASAWTELLGMSVVEFARACLVVLSVARAHDGAFDAAWLAEPTLKAAGVPEEQVQHVFHGFMAAELADIKTRAQANRSADPALRRLDFNPLIETPFVGLGGGRYIAPSMHLAEQRLGLAAIYYLGCQRFGDLFASDLGKLIEAYVGRQLRQVDYDELVPELLYGPKKSRRLTCDWVLSMAGISTIFEVKAARVAWDGRVGYQEYLADMRGDVGKALEKQVPATAQLIRTRDSVYAQYDLPAEVHGVVITAEPHLVINSQHYRSVMPNPGCPYVVLSLDGLEWFVSTLRVGADACTLVRALTATTDRPESAMVDSARAIGIEDIPGNPLILRAFERVMAGLDLNGAW